MVLKKTQEAHRLLAKYVAFIGPVRSTHVPVLGGSPHLCVVMSPPQTDLGSAHSLRTPASSSESPRSPSGSPKGRLCWNLTYLTGMRGEAGDSLTETFPRGAPGSLRGSGDHSPAGPGGGHAEGQGGPR